MYRETEQETKARLSRMKARAKEWATQPIPDASTKAGWTLDQFADQFEPQLVRTHKLNLIIHTDPCVTVPIRKIDLAQRIQARLLEKRFEVTGLRPGSYVREVVPQAMIEILLPSIETSELLETDNLEFGRRYERVLVLDRSAGKTSRGGRKPTYDCDALFKQMEAEKPKFRTEAAIIAYVQQIVRPFPGKKASKNGPDAKTIRARLRKYGSEKLIENE